MWNSIFRAAVVGSVLSLAACASSEAAKQQQEAQTAEKPVSLYDDQRDPIERINRPIWDFNYDILDKYVLRPATVGYMKVVPKPARKGLGNMAENLGEPASFINSILQAKPKKAATSAGRFLVNSTVGILGIFDVASEIGLEPAEEDFNQTLAVWGVGDGAYLMLPALGPSTVRGTVGGVVDNLYFPFTILDTPITLTRAGIMALNGREQLMQVEDMLNDSLDPYSFIKESYYQRNLFKIYDGNPPQQEETLDDDVLDFLDDVEN